MVCQRPFIVLFCLFILFADSPTCFSETETASSRLYYYSAENCPHCAEYGPQINKIVARQQGAVLVEKDIWKDRTAFQQLIDLLATHGDLPVATPTVMLGDRVWVGLDEQKLAEIEDALAACLVAGCRDTLLRLSHTTDPAAVAASDLVPEESEEESQLVVPLLGELDAREISLPLVTLVLGLLDSVNPCAFFVLLFLLSLMVHAHSRARMLTVGLVFVLFSGVIYFLFMAAWLNLFLLTGGVQFITSLAGLVAVAIGLFNIKDFFLFHQGPSLSISDKVKPGLYQRVRNLVQSAGYPSLLGGTALLAIAANSYELLCTAGFPMVYTRILTLKELSSWQYYAFLAFYNLVYIVPLLLIVILFAVTLGAHRLTEQQGRALKLISGVMMTELGAVLLVKPTLLSNLLGTVAMFFAALVIVVFILSVDRWRRSEP
jgi:hypothetical protein